MPPSRSRGRRYDTPAGVAHFLEHKMFEDKDGNALQKFARTGASPNAFTSHAMTAYHFSCTDRFAENLEILLKFVFTPYFTEENVAKERGIIAQEIGMMDDTPGWQAMVGLYEGLYRAHPVRVSIAGSVESIAQITPETLYTCHRAFYSPRKTWRSSCAARRTLTRPAAWPRSSPRRTRPRSASGTTARAARRSASCS